MVGVLFTILLPWLVAWHISSRLPADWFADPGGLKLPKAEVALLVSVVGTLMFLAFVSTTGAI